MMIEALFNLFINILPILMFILVFAFGLYTFYILFVERMLYA